MPSSQTFMEGRLAALTVLCAATMMTVLDETVVNVAIPSIQRDLGFTTHDLSWVMNAYLVSFGSLLLLAGRVGDLIGRHRVLLGGLSTFTAASLVCGLAPDTTALVIARFVQGAGAALASSVALGMIVSMFDDPTSRARAIGIYSFMASAGASAGLFLGGVITEVAGWRWAFFINVPIGLVMLVAGSQVLTKDVAANHRERPDYPGAVLLVGGLATTIVAVVDPEQRPMAIPAVILIGAFAVRQIRADEPLIPLSVLKARPVIGANLVLALLGGSMLAFQYLITLYFQNVLRYTPWQSGVAILPIAAGIAMQALFVYPRISERTGPRMLIVPGMVLVAVGMFLLVFLPIAGDYVANVLPSMALFAIGGGMAVPAIMATAMSETTPNAAGVSSGMLSSSQQIGSAVGLAVLSTVAAAASSRMTGQGDPATAAAVHGYHLAWGVGTALLAVASFIATITMRRATIEEPSPEGGLHAAGSRPARLAMHQRLRGALRLTEIRQRYLDADDEQSPSRSAASVRPPADDVE